LVEIRAVITRPKNDFIPVTATWPFKKWVVDIVSPFPEGAGRVKFLVVAIDYFNKWVEAKALATITAQQKTIFIGTYCMLIRYCSISCN
jgi:hypothetical protein